ncbi:MAG: Crp/Fnr family transcriptional regulator [Hyphomicrobiales bacterium]
MSVQSNMRSGGPTLAESRSLLRERGWLSLTPGGFRDAFLEKCRLVRYGAGENLYHVGDAASGLFGLVCGRAALTIAPGERGPYLAQLIFPGAWVGDAAIITGETRLVGVRTTRPSFFLNLPLASFEALAAQVPETWRYLAVLTVQALQLAINGADDLMLRDPRQRCIAVLLRLAGCRYQTFQYEDAFDIDASQEEIAHLSNLSRNAVGSILRDLQREGMVELTYKRLRLLTPDALRKLVQPGEQEQF